MEASAGTMKGIRVVHLDSLPPTPCPCGTARRAFQDAPGAPASVHLVEISKDSRSHYHERLTETYVVLEGEGHLEADGERIPLRPGTAVMILPGTRHRAVGKLRILNICVPPFDPTDEHEAG